MKHQQQKYKCIFFDLDHTLWDYETNAKETLFELYDAYHLRERGVPDKESLYKQFRRVNLELWDLYDRELINHDYIRVERFKQILEFFGAYEEKLSSEISIEYLRVCPCKGNLMPYAVEVLDYLSEKNYRLTVVTNGFEEIQAMKLASGKIEKYFDYVVTSQKAGHRKPSEKIFQYALTANKTICDEVMMVGDNLITDIGGATKMNIDAVFFNPEKVVHNARVEHEISCLSQLKEML